VLVARGPSFRRGVVSELPSGNIDIAPTVLRLLGVTTAAPLDGRPLLEAFHTPLDTRAVAAAHRHHGVRCRLGGAALVYRAVVERVGHAHYLASLSAERS
jgi:arylsulfatase A-like enzyme